MNKNNSRVFFEQKDCFAAYEFPFGEDFLKSIFKEGYLRKYSMVGDGIYDLILYKDKIYDIRFKQAKSMLANDGKKAFRDETKDEIVAKITDKMDECGLEYTVNSGKFICFKFYNYIAKVEIVKKAKMPE